MSYKLSESELAAMLRLDDLTKRYAYCVKRIADSGSLYWLEAEQGRCVMGPDDRGAVMLPVWPHARFAEEYLRRDPVALETWAGAEPMEIGVHEFLDEDMPRLLADGYAIAAFPVAPGRASVVSAQDFEANLRFELSRIE